MSQLQGVSKQTLAMRDKHIYDLRVGGMSIPDISNRMGLSEDTISKAVVRQLSRSVKDSSQSIPLMMQMELERLETLHKGLWPFARPQLKTDSEGNPITHEDDEGNLVPEFDPPDTNVVKQLLEISKHKMKLLGFEHVSVDVIHTTVDKPSADVKASLYGAVAETKGLPSPQEAAKEETLQLLEMMGKTKVLDESVVATLMSQMTEASEEIIDVEVVEDEEEEVEEDGEEVFDLLAQAGEENGEENVS